MNTPPHLPGHGSSSPDPGVANRAMDGQQEQRLLLLSAAGTLLLAALAIGVGLATGAQAIVFDGMYDVVDAGMTGSAFLAARLIARGDDRRFQYGYWHLEPLLAFLNGAVLLVACVYGAIDGLGGVLGGGRAVHPGAGLLLVAAGAALSLVAYTRLRAHGRHLRSTLLDLDARAWLLGGVLSAGLCTAFAIAGWLERTPLGWAARYVDPAILLVLSVGLAPLPTMTVLRAAREILQLAPPELDARVSRIAAAVADRHGFIDHRSYVIRVGRAEFIEIGFVAPSSATAMTVGELDAIRAEIAQAMGGLRPGYWLTVDITADARWI